MLLDIERDGARGDLTLLINLLDQRIDGLAGLCGHILIILHQIVVQLVEQVGVVLGGNQLALEEFEDGDFVGLARLAVLKGHQAQADYFLFEVDHVLRLLAAFVLLDDFL